MKKILILGAKGMLGYDLAGVFKDNNPVLWDKEDLDITNKDQVRAKFQELKPDVVINAAAYTAVDDCESNKDLAIQVNGIAAGFLAQACKSIDALLAHYSTDYVFDGNNPQGYQEDGLITGIPSNIYGKSKLLGEQFIKEMAGGLCAGCDHGCAMQSSPDEEEHEKSLRYYIIRTSWLYGKNGPNFVDKMISLANERGMIKVVNDQFGNPTYTADLARRTKELLEGNYEFGVYHVTNKTERNKGISWFDFASEIVAMGKKDGLVQSNATIVPCSSEEFPRPAKRPTYSILVNTKLPSMRNWNSALQEYLSEKCG